MIDPHYTHFLLSTPRRRVDPYRNNAFSPYDLYSQAREKTPVPAVLTFCHHYYKLICLISLFPWIWKSVFKWNNAFSSYDCPGGHEIYNFEGPFIGYHYFILSLSNLCPEEGKMFKDKHNNKYTFYLKIISSYLGVTIIVTSKVPLRYANVNVLSSNAVWCWIPSM